MHTRRAVKIKQTYHVDSSFDHKVTSSIIIILKIEVLLDSHWELQFSIPEKGPKSEQNDPPRYQAGYGPGGGV